MSVTIKPTLYLFKWILIQFDTITICKFLVSFIEHRYHFNRQFKTVLRTSRDVRRSNFVIFSWCIAKISLNLKISIE